LFHYSFSGSYSTSLRLTFVVIIIVAVAKNEKVRIVEQTPKIMMLVMLPKNFFLYMLKPEANTIGGNTK